MMDETPGAPVTPSPGRVVVWPGRSLWIGRGHGVTTMHVHHAIQVTLALEGVCGLRTPADQDWTFYGGAVIPPHLHHVMHTSNTACVLVWVEPESAEGHALLDRFGAEGIRPIPEAAREAAMAAATPAFDEGWDDARLIRLGEDLVDILTAGARRRVAVDDRILRAIEVIRTRLHGPIELGEVAEAVYLSPSRFRHLFVEETGMAFRPYVLWLRLQKALESLSAGESPTGAAIEAGFSDTAHMTRTFSRMFGLTPGLLDQRPTKKVSRYVQGE